MFRASRFNWSYEAVWGTLEAGDLWAFIIVLSCPAMNGKSSLRNIAPSNTMESIHTTGYGSSRHYRVLVQTSCDSGFQQSEKDRRCILSTTTTP